MTGRKTFCTSQNNDGNTVVEFFGKPKTPYKVLRIFLFLYILHARWNIEIPHVCVQFCSSPYMYVMRPWKLDKRNGTKICILICFVFRTKVKYTFGGTVRTRHANPYRRFGYERHRCHWRRGQTRNNARGPCGFFSQLAFVPRLPPSMKERKKMEGRKKKEKRRKKGGRNRKSVVTKCQV